MNILLSTLILICFSAQAQLNTDTFEEKELDTLDYSNIKNVLVNDGLQEEKIKKEQTVQKIQKLKKNLKVEQYNYPNQSDFFSFMSELWLVKNAQKLNWDYPKPNYGLDKVFKSLLEKKGFYNIEFKILLLNSPNIVHFGLPAGKDTYIFLISNQFMRSLDLTKVDISLLLFEDFIRLEKNYFVESISIDKKLLSTNFYGKKIEPGLVKNVMKKYDELIFEIGYDFKQQFELTKSIDSLLKSDPVIWSAYFKLLGKIDRFIKSNVLYKDYLKIYPSPELQIKWLTPKKKLI